MEREVRESFSELIEAARGELEDVKILKHEVSAKRSILKIDAAFRGCKVSIKRAINRRRELYSYYLIKDRTVLVGYDNSPDKKALVLKYGEKDYTRHIHEAVPHVHTEDKKSIALTEEYNLEKFLQEIKKIV